MIPILLFQLGIVPTKARPKTPPVKAKLIRGRFPNSPHIKAIVSQEQKIPITLNILKLRFSK